MASEQTGDFSAERAENAFHDARGSLFQAALMNRAQLRRDGIAFLEILVVHRTAVDGPEI
jgi:hypothetical protein